MGACGQTCASSVRCDEGGEMNALITLIEVLIFAVWAGAFYLVYRIMR